MKKLLAAMAISVAVALLAFPLAYGQGAPGAPPAQAQQDKVFQGQLTKVDANAKSISVKGAGNMEMTFEWTDATQVVGSEKNVQGLAAKTGSDLKVTYRDAAGKHTATKIETIEKR
jgi:Cu/Ag efflux protein CusF